MKDKKYFVLGIILIVILSLTLVSAVYARSFNAYTQYPSFIPTGGEFQAFDRSMCEAGQDFILQISPLGCTPAVVRSDLLEEQNVPVFCPISATKLNPLIDVEAIDYMTFSGQFPQEVSGVVYHPARAALGRWGAQTDTPILDNIGYTVIVLKRQGNESAMPDFVEGNLTATIRYDIKNAFGVGQANYYLPELSDDDWEERYTQYSFWDGKGYLRAEGIGVDRATISIYSDREMSGFGRVDAGKRKLSSVNLDVGETSGEIFMPGFDYCLGSMQLRLNDLENPDTRARLKVNSDVVEVKDGERFLENRCRVRDIKKQGIVQEVTITCEEDEGRDTFPLIISPKIQLRIDGDVRKYSVGDFLYQDGDKFVYLGYVGTKDDSTSVESLYVRLMKMPTKRDEGLNDRELASVASLDKNLRESNIDEGLIDDIGKVVKGGIALVKMVGKFIAEGKSFDKVSYFDEEKNVFGTDIKLVGFAEAQDRVIKGDVKEYYDNAVQDYETILDSFAGEKYSEIDAKTLGERALSKYIGLAWSIEQKDTVVELCNEFRELYPSFIEPQECNQAYKLSSRTSSVRDVSINGRISSLSFDGIYEPSFKDYGVFITIIEPGSKGNITEITLTKNEIYYINESTNEFIQLVDLDEDSARVNINILSEGGVISRAGKYLFLSERKTIKEGESLAREGYVFTIDEINLKKLAKVSVVPNINYAQTTADFKFKIGIEKRLIQLSPEKTRVKINSLNETLTKWRDRSDKLGKVVKGLKTACLGTGAVLTVKNFFANLGGKGIARQKVMRGENGWVEICEPRVNSGEYGNMDSCLLDNSDAINSAVDEYSDAMERQNEELEGLQNLHKDDDGFLGEDIIDTSSFMRDFVDDDYRNELNSSLAGLETIKVGNEQVPVSDIISAINENTTFLTQARNLQLNSRLLDSDNEQVGQMARDQIEADLTDIWVNNKDEQERTTFAGSFGNAAALFSSNEKLIEIPITDVKIWRDVKNEFTTGANIDDNTFIFKLKDKSNAEEYLLVLDNNHIVTETYLIGTGNALTRHGEENKPNPLNIAFKYFDRSSYENQYQNAEVRYYETEPYKGLPAIVPFDVSNGWYASVKSTLPIGGAIRAYDDSGRVSSFYLCNVGRNGREEFNSGIGDDICEMINLGTGQPFNQFHGLDEGEASRLVSQAVEAIRQASRAHRTGVSDVRLSIPGLPAQTIKVGTPYTNIPDIQCQDFMSPSDCNLLFNVCDPVVCPSSRCDLDGNYPVQDVIQSGIVGSIALCLPNFPEVKVPICLSGVHAGIEGYLSVVDSYQQCLQTSLDTGQTVGICDEIYSIHMCEFFWRQSLPLAQVAIPKIIGTVLGQNVRGGGEYLGVQDAWSNAEQSVDYFTQYYAANSYQAFKARSAEGVGGEVCKNFVSVLNPQGGNLLDALTEPDVPAQFYGRFDEIPFTTATNPPISQYKVFYHIYAGKDVPAYYEVYLRDPTGSSFYQDTAFRRIVAKGFIAVGDYATETRDFTAPSGYKQLCIIVNGREECGFKQVSTDFSVNYITDKYMQEQASQRDIKSETQCISGSPSAYSLLNPNLQAGAEEVLNPAIYNRGIIRICATDNPGRNSDATAGIEGARWKDVGYCDNTKMRCWLDAESVRDVVKITSIEDQILGEVEDDYLERLRAEGDYLTDEGFETLVQEIDDLENNNLGIIEKVDENLLKVFLNNQRGYLHLLRGNAYRNLAVLLFQEIKPTEDEEEEPIELDVSEIIEESIREAEELERALESGTTSPIFEFKDGRLLTGNLYYIYSGNSWYWSDDKEDWISVEVSFIKEDIPGAVPADVLDVVFPFEGLSERNQQFIISLKEKDYSHGLRPLMDRTTRDDEGGLRDPELSTENVDFSKDKIFTVGQERATDLYLEYDLGDLKWRWSHDKYEWVFVPRTALIDGSRPAAASINIINNLEGESYYPGAEIIFGIDSSVSGVSLEEETTTGECSTRTECQKVTGQKIIEIARQKKTEHSISDESVRQDTGAKSFECLVLQVAYTESRILHCERNHENNDPLYCEGDIDKIRSGDEKTSLGVMQINKNVHGEKLFFEENVER
jgi:hypothetical protein